MVDWLGPWTGRVGLPAEALPMALLRPLSGSGAYGILASIVQDPAIGPESYTGYRRIFLPSPPEWRPAPIFSGRREE